VTLIPPEGVEIPARDYPDGPDEATTVIAAGKSVKFTETFAPEYAELGGFAKGEYTAVATVRATVDGEPVEITVELPIKLK